MEKYIDGISFDISSISYRYGKDECAEDYKSITNISDNETRNKEVDTLIYKLNRNKNNNGFFGSNDIVYINMFFGHAIKLDDNAVYYSFFKNLNKAFKNKAKEETDGLIVAKSIIKTISDYYGLYDGMNKKRFELTETYFDENDDYVVPSIKNLKGQHSAACVECSSLAHNLWLMTGVESYYVVSRDVGFNNDSNDGHAFVIVKYDDEFRIFDMAQSIYKKLNEDPIKLFDKRKPLIINDKIYTYASMIKQR